MESFKFEQPKEEQDFQHETLRRDQEEQARQAEHERQLRLQRPATPDESY